MTVSTKEPKYILRKENRGVDDDPVAISSNRGTLMHSHEYQQGSLPLRHANFGVL